MDANGRDTRGRFAPGWKGGPGRPPAATEMAYVAALRKSIPPDDLAALARKLFDLAMAGDTKAARLVLQFLCPQPSLRVELDEWQKAHEYRVAGMTREELVESMRQRLSDAVSAQRARIAAATAAGAYDPQAIDHAASPSDAIVGDLEAESNGRFIYE